MTEPTETSPELTGNRPRRGRPRSQVTLARDDAVLNLLRDGQAWSRRQLADRLNEKSSLVYLALWRLSRDHRVERAGDAGAERHTWRLVS